MDRKDFLYKLDEMRRDLLVMYDQGLTEGTIEYSRAAIEVPRNPNDRHRNYVAGSLRIVISLKDPAETRPEEFS